MSILCRPLALGLALAASAGAHATCTLIHAGTLIERADRAPRSNASLLVCEGKVSEVRDGHVEVAAFGESGSGATVVDLKGHTVLPGLIDSHVHLVSDRAGVAAQLAAVTDEVPDMAYEAAWNARKTLRAGFTTVRNLGDGHGVTLALRDAIREGKAVGPRIFDAGQSISVTSGHMDGRLGYASALHAAVSSGANLCDGADECRKTVRRQIGRGVDVIKIATTGGVNSRIGAGIGQQMFEDEARAIVETAHLAGKKVAVHAHGADGVRLALAVGADSIEHGTLLDDAGLKLMKQSGAWLVATMSTVNGYQERIAADPNAYSPEVRTKIDWRIGITGKSFRRAVEAGVNIAFGTDAGVSMHGRNADEFELMVEHGMTPQQALVAATLGSATLLGEQERLGSLEPGKLADVIAVQGNPLDDVRVLKRVDWVMQGGRVVHSPERPLE
jgi:imidazolonepropionase-like amidohydrolase